MAFIGLHIGAGFHSEKYDSVYRELCTSACSKGMEVLKSGGSSIDAVTVATACLEDSELTNAGFGSNLTWDGHVECDACVMDGSRLGFGAVGALGGVRNPVQVAKSLCKSQETALTLKRVHPLLLVGEGALKWAEQAGHPAILPSSLISEKAKKTYEKYMQRAKSESGCGKVSWKRLDTVGAVAIDLENKIASSCSSGGILLKQPGRIGQAAIFGCGCWAENCTEELSAIGISTSGGGEDLIRTNFARVVADTLSDCVCPVTSLNNAMKESFLCSKHLHENSQRLCGLIALVVKDNKRDFIWSHTTASMIIAHMSSSYKSPKVRISRLPSSILPGSTSIIEGVSW